MKWALVAFFLVGESGQSAFAHSSDFVFARWNQDSVHGLIELSLSIQISNNPNIENREQAVQVLSSLMQVSPGSDDGFVPLSAVAKADFEDGVSFPQDSPVPIGGAGLEALESGVVDEEGAEKHEVLTLKWKWQAPAGQKQMAFFLPMDSQQTVVFWWANAVGGEAPWQIMLGGDESFPLVVMEVGGRGGMGGLVRRVLPGLLGVLVIACYLLIRRRWTHAEAQRRREERFIMK